MRRAVVVIPARWASSRFPGKVLATIGGRSLVQRACEIAQTASCITDFIVATDDERVRTHVEKAGFRALMTSADHPSGTDRVAEAARSLEAEIIIGLQADEPFLLPADIDRLAETLAGDDPPALATLAIPLRQTRDWLDPNVVKVVVDHAGRALYFSRSPLPYRRKTSGTMATLPEGPPPPEGQIHVGVYAWQREALLAFAAMKPSPLEGTEGLEQLRALEAGWAIAVLPAAGTPFGIDTPHDLQRAERWLADHTADHHPARPGVHRTEIS